ncbi:multidrug ABC transporter permease [Candidatus Magnetominusculus xianensis]|uniref:Multidrug ABC transporter permease n=1 Tax=Candidatus Magnetominusculus xianensis TaxID=1748249 RepID=A0ABR5SE54_9BACT|nr:ABC transporter permease [Candidatus Magnetominusculus xianensis]KWT82587.1 multidrug ABC transporter permease [Candidatus Magnetominusculus xianensis]
MIGLMLQYSLRNLLRRRLTTTLTALGMGLVVFVFAAVLMLSNGLVKTLVTTGSSDNVVVLRKSAGVEMQSQITHEDADIIESHSSAKTDVDGRKLSARELVILVSLPKKITGKPANVAIRGVTDKSYKLRPVVKLSQGRFPRAGSTEIAIGKSIAKGFNAAEIGQTFRFAMQDWVVVGIFDAENRGFNSEIWGDVNVLSQFFKRNVYSSVIFKLNSGNKFDGVKERILHDPRLKVDIKRENLYYEEQSEMMSKFLTILGISLTLIFSLGAIIGAMITMYTATATRTAEIGTLRALGFGRVSILMAFISESLLLGGVGGIAGLFFASFLQFFTVSTMNWQTFSELAFTFSLNFEIVLSGFAFSLIMGFAGGVLPAIKASRMNIVDSLRNA